MTTDYLITLMISFFAILLLSFYWFTNLFYIIIENRRIERAKLLNDQPAICNSLLSVFRNYQCCDNDYNYAA